MAFAHLNRIKTVTFGSIPRLRNFQPPVFERLYYTLITHRRALNTSRSFTGFFPAADDTLLFKSRPLSTVFTYVNGRPPSHRGRLNFSISVGEIRKNRGDFPEYRRGGLPQFPSTGGWSSVRSNYRLICTDPLFFGFIVCETLVKHTSLRSSHHVDDKTQISNPNGSGRQLSRQWRLNTRYVTF